MKGISALNLHNHLHSYLDACSFVHSLPKKHKQRRSLALSAGITSTVIFHLSLPQHVPVTLFKNKQRNDALCEAHLHSHMWVFPQPGVKGSVAPKILFSAFRLSTRSLRVTNSSYRLIKQWIYREGERRRIYRCVGVCPLCDRDHYRAGPSFLGGSKAVGVLKPAVTDFLATWGQQKHAVSTLILHIITVMANSFQQTWTNWKLCFSPPVEYK